jgi:4-hydroxybenzoate polyprenyltransferase
MSTIFHRLRETFHALRIPEALLMTGFVFAVPLTTVSPPALTNPPSTAPIFIVAIGLHFIAFYTWNSYFGYLSDLRNERLSAQSQLDRRDFAIAAITLSVAAIITFLFGTSAWIAAGSALSICLWIWYSIPNVGLKEVPLAGTFVHVATGTIHGLMALAIFDQIGDGHWLVAVWFGALFSSGHLVHEAIDREADEEAGVLTTCVRYGYRVSSMMLLGVIAVLCASAILLWSESVPTQAFLPFVAASVLHVLIASYTAFPIILGHDTTTDTDFGARFLILRRIHRLSYGVAGLSVSFFLIGQ